MLIVDFDKTIVTENSSRVLEREVFNSLKTPFRRCILYIIFFSPLKVFTNIFFYLIALLFYDRQDLRLRAFMSMCKKEFMADKDLYFKATSQKLTFNGKILKYLGEGDFVILSNGIRDIIVSFLDSRGIGCSAVESSLFSAGKLALKNIHDKINYLAAKESFTYLTDDPKELSLLKKKCLIEVKKIDGLFMASKV